MSLDLPKKLSNFFFFLIYKGRLSLNYMEIYMTLLCHIFCRFRSHILSNQVSIQSHVIQSFCNLIKIHHHQLLLQLLFVVSACFCLQDYLLIGFLQLLCDVPTGFPYALDIHEASEKTAQHTSYYQDLSKPNKYSQEKQKLNFTLKLEMN